MSHENDGLYQNEDDATVGVAVGMLTMKYGVTNREAADCLKAIIALATHEHLSLFGYEVSAVYTTVYKDPRSAMTFLNRLADHFEKAACADHSIKQAEEIVAKMTQPNQ